MLPRLIPVFVLSLGLLATASCAKKEKHTYAVPDDVVYSPERGIYRLGAATDKKQESLFREGLRLFDERNFRLAAERFRSLRLNPRWLDGSRAPEAAILEAIALLEAGRETYPGWMLDDLCNAYFFYDESRPGVVEREFPRIPAELIGEGGADAMRAAAEEVSESDAIEDSWEVTRDIFEYYGAGLGATPPSYVLEISRHGRNLAWLAYLAEDDNLAEEIARDLRNRGLQGSVSARAEIILAKTLVRQDIGIEASSAYQRASKESRDLAIVEEALLGEVQTLIESSKGWRYDKRTYEKALAKINEYKQTFLLRNAAVARYGKAFAELERDALRALYRQYLESANAYRKLGEDKSANIYLEEAEAFRQRAIAQQAQLSGDDVDDFSDLSS